MKTGQKRTKHKNYRKKKDARIFLFFPLSIRKDITRQEGPDGARDGQNGGNGDEAVVEHALLQRDLAAEDLEVEGQRQNDAQREAQRRAEEGHEAVKVGEENGNDDERHHDQHADAQPQEATRQARRADERLAVGHRARIEAREHFNGAEERSRATKKTLSRKNNRKI